MHDCVTAFRVGQASRPGMITMVNNSHDGSESYLRKISTLLPTHLKRNSSAWPLHETPFITVCSLIFGFSGVTERKRSPMTIYLCRFLRAFPTGGREALPAAEAHTQAAATGLAADCTARGEPRWRHFLLVIQTNREHFYRASGP